MSCAKFVFERAGQFILAPESWTECEQEENESTGEEKVFMVHSGSGGSFYCPPVFSERFNRSS